MVNDEWLIVNDEDAAKYLFKIVPLNYPFNFIILRYFLNQ